MQFSTTPTLEGQPIVEYCGVVTGEAILGANIFRDFFAGIRDIVGGRAGSYEKSYAKHGKSPFTNWASRQKHWARTRSWVLISIMKPSGRMAVC